MFKKIIFIIVINLSITQTYPEFGNSQNLDIVTWNIENFPKHPYTIDYVARILARSKYYKVVLASGSQRTSRQQLAVQTSNNHAKPKKRMDVSPHINHVDSWLTFIEELTPIRR